jgi:hypothetical protein
VAALKKHSMNSKGRINMIQYKHFDAYETEITINDTFAMGRIEISSFEEEYDNLMKKYRI